MNTERARVALVTGASRNIGRAIAIAIAIALARDGIDVAVHAANNRVAVEETARLVRANGRRAVVVTGDLTEPRTVSELVAQVAGEMGALDVLVHNAATRPETTIDDLAYAEWRHVMGVSLDAMFLLAQAALPHLRAGVDPAVVALGGMSAHTGARNRPHVVAAKAGLVGLVRALAHDLAPNVTANIVVPGLIDTVRDGAAPHHHGSRTNLAGRCGRPEEVADAVALSRQHESALCDRSDLAPERRSLSALARKSLVTCTFTHDAHAPKNSIWSGTQVNRTLSSAQGVHSSARPGLIAPVAAG